MFGSSMVTCLGVLSISLGDLVMVCERKLEHRHVRRYLSVFTLRELGTLVWQITNINEVRLTSPIESFWIPVHSSCESSKIGCCKFTPDSPAPSTRAECKTRLPFFPPLLEPSVKQGSL